MKKILIAIFQIFFPIVLGSIVGFLTSSSLDYNNLVKPLFSPPGILFPIIWSIIYLLMGISYFLFRKNFNDFFLSLIYYLQLFVNLLWSFIFFVFKLRFLAIIWIILLVILVMFLIYLFYKSYKPSAYLNILYLGWCLFATYLTIGIYILN